MNKIIEKLKHCDSESTSFPYWIIIEPKQNMSLDIHYAASQITGIFFSRKDAQEFLDRTHYNFSKRARVYCHSGHQSEDYRRLFEQ